MIGAGERGQAVVGPWWGDAAGMQRVPGVRMESLRADSAFSRGYPETACTRGGTLQGRCERRFRAGRAGCWPALALQPPGACSRADPGVQRAAEVRADAPARDQRQLPDDAVGRTDYPEWWQTATRMPRIGRRQGCEHRVSADTVRLGRLRGDASTRPLPARVGTGAIRVPDPAPPLRQVVLGGAAGELLRPQPRRPFRGNLRRAPTSRVSPRRTATAT